MKNSRSTFPKPRNKFNLKNRDNDISVKCGINLIDILKLKIPKWHLPKRLVMVNVYGRVFKIL